MDPRSGAAERQHLTGVSSDALAISSFNLNSNHRADIVTSTSNARSIHSNEVRFAHSRNGPCSQPAKKDDSLLVDRIRSKREDFVSKLPTVEQAMENAFVSDMRISRLTSVPIRMAYRRDTRGCG